MVLEIVQAVVYYCTVRTSTYQESLAVFHLNHMNWPRKSNLHLPMRHCGEITFSIEYSGVVEMWSEV